jgi:hypothetical protein
MKNHTKYTALITSSLLIVALAGPANAAPPETTETPITSEIPALTPNVIAETTATVSFEKPAVKTTPAPVRQDYKLQPVSAPEVKTSPTQPEAPTSKTATSPAPELQPIAPVSASGKGAAIASAAYAQLGVPQDCTRLATNSLAAVGIHHHGWPASYLALGTRVSAAEAQPGDLAYYANGGTGLAHIAVYVGNGKAVHGGWNGGTTSLQSVNVGSGPVFVRVA